VSVGQGYSRIVPAMTGDAATIYALHRRGKTEKSAFMSNL
jgi:hypothetical protein